MDNFNFTFKREALAVTATADKEFYKQRPVGSFKRAEIRKPTSVNQTEPTVYMIQ
jgi:hypothetical protein